ncbi:MAG: hypothetical protein KIT87_16900 [Anaerolineae bacterium]|nr:hypothetical protein [Anaerolineae bacterium]
MATVDDALYAVQLATGETVSTTVGLGAAQRLVLDGEKIYVAGVGGLRVVRWPMGAAPEVVGAYDGVDVTALAVRGGLVALGSDAGVDLVTGAGQRWAAWQRRRRWSAWPFWTKHCWSWTPQATSTG